MDHIYACIHNSITAKIWNIFHQCINTFVEVSRIHRQDQEQVCVPQKQGMWWMVNHGLQKAGIQDASQPLLQLLLLVIFNMPFFNIWSHVIYTLIEYYKIKVVNVTAPGMLAQVTRLFFAIGRDSLGTRLQQLITPPGGLYLIM